MVSLCLGQSVNTVNVSRWIFDGVPNIQGLVQVMEGSIPNKIWFTQTDSHKVAYITLKACKDAPLTEYNVSPIYPYKVAYAEKAYILKNGKTKFNSNVWFTTSDYTDSLYTIIGDRRNTYLVGYPSGFANVSPSLIQWQEKDKFNHAKFWFTDANWGNNTLYSFEPIPSSLNGIVKAYPMPDTGSITTLRVENGYVWTTLDDGEGDIILYALSITGTSAYRWEIGRLPGIGERDVQPVYNVNNPKLYVLPYQVWIAGEIGVATLRLDPNLKGTVDTVCTSLTELVNQPRGLFSNPAAMKKNTANWQFIASYQDPDAAYISAVRAKPSIEIDRYTVLITPTTVNVNGIVHPITMKKSIIGHMQCSKQQVFADTSGCLTDYWHTLNSPTFAFNFFSALGPIDIVGKATPTHFDMVFYEPVVELAPGSPTSTIDWFSGDYKSFVKIASSNSLDEEAINRETEMNFALDDAYPNPFNPTTTLSFVIGKSSLVTLKVYDVLGREVASLLNNEKMEQGRHEVVFDASHLPSGVYFYQLNAGSFSSVKKLILTK